jgi:hypothetical protein
MVRRAMLEGRAPYSVESAFSFAYDEIREQHPDKLPSINDGIPEDLVLGPRPELASDEEYAAAASGPAPGWSYSTYGTEGAAQPSPTPRPYRRRGPAAVCGNVRYNCGR